MAAFFFCDPGGSRTHNLQNRNLTFYPLNYGARLNIALSVLDIVHFSHARAKLIKYDRIPHSLL